MITQGMSVFYKKDMFDGLIHTASDTYKAALFTSLADLAPQTETYTSANETAGPGYTPGGKTITGFKSYIDGESVVLTFENIVWKNASIKAGGFLIYNASKANKSVFIGSFGGDIVSTNDTFTIEIPETGLVRL